MRGLVWFKKDLRTSDHPALYHASQECADGIAAVFIFDEELWEKNDVGLVQREFILKNISVLQEDLFALKIPLFILQVAKTATVVQEIARLMQRCQLQKIYFNRELEYNEMQREALVQKYLLKQNIDIAAFDEQLILPAARLQNKQGDYYKVFSAFKRRWLMELHQSDHHISLLPRPKIKKPLIIEVSAINNVWPKIHSGIDLTPWPAGERAARQRLKQFIKNKLFSYAKERDFPAHDGTSQLSPYLAQGIISGRECFQQALFANNQELSSGKQGALVWMSELIWREFYRYILIAAPWVSRGQAYQRATDRLAWHYNADLLAAWQQGKTGYPLVDAAMRQLNITGWMHNRLRMVSAMFLSKNLFLNWRLGEAYFARHLIDFDFASNNGGWQWSASTGVDAVPYFRLFNPERQGQRFDADGDFIKHYCPELAMLDRRAIHNPVAKIQRLNKTLDYPAPMVDFAASRTRVLAAFKALVTKKR